MVMIEYGTQGITYMSTNISKIKSWFKTIPHKIHKNCQGYLINLKLENLSNSYPLIIEEIEGNLVFVKNLIYKKSPEEFFSKIQEKSCQILFDKVPLVFILRSYIKFVKNEFVRGIELIFPNYDHTEIYFDRDIIKYFLPIIDDRNHIISLSFLDLIQEKIEIKSNKLYKTENRVQNIQEQRLLITSSSFNGEEIAQDLKENKDLWISYIVGKYETHYLMELKEMIDNEFDADTIYFLIKKDKLQEFLEMARCWHVSELAWIAKDGIWEGDYYQFSFTYQEIIKQYGTEIEKDELIVRLWWD